MFSTARRVRFLPVVLTAAVVLCVLVVPSAARAQDASLFRIFLLEGEPLVSYGEFARVADRVVFSVPIGGPAAPTLQMVSVPANLVDWNRTEAYAHAVRSRRYAETRGENDFALLAARVTSALNDINLHPDPKRRIAMAEEARRNLAAWPAANYGYRAAEVAELVALLDDALAQMRASTGETGFQLSLVATTTPPPPAIELLPDPDTQVSMESAFRAALISPDPAERIALLRVLQESLKSPESAPFASLRTRTASALDAELRVERAYGAVMRSALQDSAQRVARGDVGGLQQIIARVLKADDRLGRKRGGEMSALLAALDMRLDEARRVRVAMDAWAARVDVFKRYRRATEEPRDRMASLLGDLRQIRDRKGPGRRSLQRVEIHATMAIHELKLAEVPPELHTSHGLLISALQLARQAAALRRNAVSSNDTTLAWDASSAAAGALMFAERAADELNSLISATTPR